MDYHKRSNLAEDTYPRGIFDERTFYSTKSGGALRKAENNSAFQVWLNKINFPKISIYDQIVQLVPHCVEKYLLPIRFKPVYQIRTTGLRIRIRILIFSLVTFKIPLRENIFTQGFGSGSGSAWIRINLSCWIRIRIQIADPDPDPGGKNDSKNRKKDRIFIFWSAGCSLLRAEGFSCSLGVLYGGLGISKLQFLIKKQKLNFLL